MENLLSEYMERAFADRGITGKPGPGPVITISREYGCPSKLIAQKLSDTLNRKTGSARPGLWRFVNKEVVETTARRLDMNPTEVNYILSSGNKGILEDVLASFSQSYVSNMRIRKTISGVIRSIAEQGHVIIVGRGGAAILANTPNSLHIRLNAPHEWRVNQVCSARNINGQEASKLVDEMDKKRMALIELMSGEKYNPYLFNITFNCKLLTHDEMIGSIIGLMETKNMTT